MSGHPFSFHRAPCVLSCCRGHRPGRFRNCCPPPGPRGERRARITAAPRWSSNSPMCLSHAEESLRGSLRRGGGLARGLLACESGSGGVGTALPHPPFARACRAVLRVRGRRVAQPCGGVHVGPVLNHPVSTHDVHGIPCVPPGTGNPNAVLTCSSRVSQVQHTIGLAGYAHPCTQFTAGPGSPGRLRGQRRVLRRPSGRARRGTGASSLRPRCGKRPTRCTGCRSRHGTCDLDEPCRLSGRRTRHRTRTRHCGHR